jgi:hypothetical protein
LVVPEVQDIPVSSDGSQVETAKSPDAEVHGMPLPGVNVKLGLYGIPLSAPEDPLPLLELVLPLDMAITGVPGLLPEHAGSVSPPAASAKSAPAPYIQRITLMSLSSLR